MPLQNTPTLETERLILRKFTAEDMDALYAIFSDRETNTFLPWSPVTSREEARALFWEQRYARAYERPAAYQYAVCLKTDNVPIGYVGASLQESHDLGYGLRHEFWRQGVISEAAAAVIAQLQRDGVPFVTATHDRENPRSGAVMRRLGMEYRYSYREQWMPKDISVVFRLYQLNLDGNTQRVYEGYKENYPDYFIEDIEE